jgi:hypothetical protein
MPAEYDPVATETFWARVLPFVRRCGSNDSMPAAT